LAQTPAVDAALNALRQAGSDVNQQAAAVRGLTALGAATEGGLLAALADSDRQVRLNAALALGRLRTAAAVEPLLARCREDGDPEVRGGAAEALGRIGDPRAVGALVGQLTGAESHELDRRGAAVALGSLRATEAVEPLLKLLDAANWEERWRAAVALGQIGDPRARTALGHLAGDGNAVVAGCAAWASSVLVNAPSTKGLEANLRGADDSVTWGSAWALGIIGTTTATEALLAALKNGTPAAQSASRMVLAWLGMPMPAAPAATVASAATVPMAVPDSGGFLALDERWSDRYGKLDIRITRPVVLSSRATRPELGTQARPCLYRLPNGDLLLLVETETESAAAPRAALRSRDQGQTWQSEPTLVNRVAAVASLRNRSVLVYDQYLFQKEGQHYVSDLCISRDGGRSFGPLQLAEFALAVEPPARSVAKEVIEAYKASSARGSERAGPGFAARLVELADDSLVACGLARAGAATSTGAVCYRSADRGLTWTAGALLARDEVAALALASGGGNRLLALLASGPESALRASFSADAGATWAEPRSLRERASAVDLCRLPSGVLVCCYGGPGLSLMFSADGTGKAWTDKIRLAEPGEGVSGSASLCEAGPDRLLLVYDQQGIIPEVGTAPTSALRCAYITVTPAGAATTTAP
jgi:HEAT repeat protein